MPRDGVTTIGRLTVQVSRPADYPPASAPAGLEQAELRPPGLRPGEVLLVKHFPDPLPGALRMTGSGPVPPAWERAAVAALEQELHRSIRPARAVGEAVAASSANSVVFGDWAEILATVAQEWLADRLDTSWWWPRLREMATQSTSAGLHGVSATLYDVTALWRRHALYVPAAMGLLARRAVASSFARALPDTVSVELVTEVMAAKGVTAEAIPAEANPTEWVSVTSRENSAEFVEGPWAQTVPEAREIGLTPDQERLLGVCLALHRRPMIIGHREFWTAATQWHTLATENLVREQRDEQRTKVPVIVDNPSSPTLFDTGAAIGTDLGGLFYLLNLALHLGLYGDFTQPAAPCLDTHPFDLLYLWGRELVDQPDDPIWALLPQLAGRTAAEPPTEQPWIPEFTALAVHELATPLGIPPDKIPELVLRHQATVSVSPAHLNARFSLRELPIQIRMAGLDRDPGWIPAADRAVAFHFD